MINGLGVVGWGVGGIEAEAAMLGRSMPMLIPEVIGFRSAGSLRPGATATDLVLTVTQMLRKKGVVGKFVEYFGPGSEHCRVADRATLGNMSPEYGATMGFFPVDEQTLTYLRLTGRGDGQIKLIEAYCKAQGLFNPPARPSRNSPTPSNSISAPSCRAWPGPRRPQDRVRADAGEERFRRELARNSASIERRSRGAGGVGGRRRQCRASVKDDRPVEARAHRAKVEVHPNGEFP